MREQNEFDYPVPRDKALEICARMQQKKWRYIWNWIPRAGCWVCCKMNRINLDNPMGCRLVHRNYERQK